MVPEFFLTNWSALKVFSKKSINKSKKEMREIIEPEQHTNKDNRKTMNSGIDLNSTTSDSIMRNMCDHRKMTHPFYSRPRIHTLCQISSEIIMMDFDDDFEFLNSNMNSIIDHQKDIFDFPICHSTPSLSRSKQPTRAIDFPSTQKHYGLVTFFDSQLPIIYRLMNDNYYIPYIRFSYVLNIFEHSSLKKFLVNIRNLPVIEMTPTERVYYDQLSSLDDQADWSNSQLLNISILDGALAIISLAQNFNFQTDSSLTQWQEAMNTIRQETRNQWILDEKIVLSRLADHKTIDSACISSNTLAKRRSFFEQRLDHSIVDEAGGFVQIEAFVYPFIKNPLDNQIYINIDDIRQNIVRPLSDLITYSNPTSPMSRAYDLILQQAQSNSEWNRIRHGRTNDLFKFLPSGKGMERYFNEEIPFLPLQSLLHLFLTKNSTLNLQFVQLFETSTLDEIESNYQTNVARQFIMKTKRYGGLINDKIPCLIHSQMNGQSIWIPSETKTRRIMTNDERFYLNLILLYHGLWKRMLTRKKQWYLKEMNANDKENIHLEILHENKTLFV